jgi:hypothetical protein
MRTDCAILKRLDSSSDNRTKFSKCSINSARLPNNKSGARRRGKRKVLTRPSPHNGEGVVTKSVVGI